MSSRFSFEGPELKHIELQQLRKVATTHKLTENHPDHPDLSSLLDHPDLLLGL